MKTPNHRVDTFDEPSTIDALWAPNWGMPKPSPTHGDPRAEEVLHDDG